MKIEKGAYVEGNSGNQAFPEMLRQFWKCPGNFGNAWYSCNCRGNSGNLIYFNMFQILGESTTPRN